MRGQCRLQSRRGVSWLRSSYRSSLARARRAANVLETQAAARHDVVLSEFQNALAAKMRRRNAVVGLVEKEHRPLTRLHLRKVRDSEREAVKCSPFEVHPDGIAAGRSLECFFDVKKDSG